MSKKKDNFDDELNTGSLFSEEIPIPSTLRFMGMVKSHDDLPKETSNGNTYVIEDTVYKYRNKDEPHEYYEEPEMVVYHDGKYINISGYEEAVFYNDNHKAVFCELVKE